MKKSLLVIAIIALALLLCSCGTIGYTYINGNRYTAGETTIRDRVDELDINWLEGSVTVEYHDGSRIEVTETSGRSLSSDKQLHWYLEGRTLHVRYAKAGVRMLNGLSKHLTIKLPRELELDKVKIAVASAEVAADGINAEDIHIQSASGRVALRQTGSAESIKVETASGAVAIAVADTERLKVNSASGEVVVDAYTMDELGIDTASGKITVQLATAADRIDVNSVSGNVTLYWPEGEGFTADVDSLSGRVGGSLALNSRDKGEYSYLGGGCEIKVDTVSGNVMFEKNATAAKGW